MPSATDLTKEYYIIMHNIANKWKEVKSALR